jgi:hypothetical protein
MRGVLAERVGGGGDVDVDVDVDVYISVYAAARGMRRRVAAGG